MFSRHLKHDLVFGRTMFISLGVCIILFALAGLVFFHISEDIYTARNAINISTFFAMGLVLGFVAVHFSQFIEKSMFGDSGYLTLTLPISRGRLLFSKLMACWIWYNFVLIAILVAIAILSSTQDPADLMVGVIPPVSLSMITYYINMMFVFFFMTNMLLFGLTLLNSVFGRWKVPGFITAIFCLSTIIGYCVAILRLMNRSREMVMENFTRVVAGETVTTTQMGWQRITGMDVGRLELLGSYVDIYIAAIGLVLGLAAFFGTWYLLKQRVSLQ